MTTNDLHEELAELKKFIAELKADRAESKEKERREAWTKYVSLTLVIVAVIGAITTQWANKYSSRMLVHLNHSTYYQAKASDQWGYYQAKSIKQNLYEVSHAQLSTLGGTVPALEKAQEEFHNKIAKYEKEKQEIKAEAELLEKQRDQAREVATDASERGSGMGLAVAIFSISIALGSICLVTKKKWLWFVSLALAGTALAQSLFVWLK